MHRARELRGNELGGEQLLQAGEGFQQQGQTQPQGHSRGDGDHRGEDACFPGTACRVSCVMCVWVRPQQPWLPLACSMTLPSRALTETAHQ